MTKKTALLFFLSCICIVGFTQNKKVNKNIAPFKIQMLSGQQFTYQQLQKDKPVVLVYFSPTCDHCKNFTKALLQHEKELASKQIVMVTYLPVAELKPFIDSFHLDKYPNIKVGTEGYTFIVQKYYNVQRFPFVVLYDKQIQLENILPYSENVDATVSQILKM